MWLWRFRLNSYDIFESSQDTILILWWVRIFKRRKFERLNSCHLGYSSNKYRGISSKWQISLAPRVILSVFYVERRSMIKTGNGQSVKVLCKMNTTTGRLLIRLLQVDEVEIGRFNVVGKLLQSSSCTGKDI